MLFLRRKIIAGATDVNHLWLKPGRRIFISKDFSVITLHNAPSVPTVTLVHIRSITNTESAARSTAKFYSAFPSIIAWQICPLSGISGGVATLRVAKPFLCLFGELSIAILIRFRLAW